MAGNQLGGAGTALAVVVGGAQVQNQAGDSADNADGNGSEASGSGSDDNPYARWDQHWPTACGPAAIEIKKALGSMADQKARAKAHYNLLKADDGNMYVLNGDNHPVAYMLLKPNEFTARIVYSIGVPLDILNSLNPNKLTNFSALMLDLKGGRSYPAAISFPSSVREVKTIKIPSVDMVEDISANFPEQWPAWTRANRSA